MATEANKRRLETNSASPEGCKSKKSKKRCQKQRGDSGNGSLVCCVCDCIIVEDTDEKTGKMLYFVRVVVIVGYTINVQVSQVQPFSIYQIQTNPFCVSTAFYQIKLFK